MLTLAAMIALTATAQTESLDGRIVTLRSHHGKYVVAEQDGRARADREAADAWERWTVVVHGGDVVSLRSHHGKYLAAETRGGANANRDRIDAWEKWRLVRHPNGKVSFESHHGTYLVAEQDGELNANRTEIREWEMFELTVVGVADRRAAPTPPRAKTASAAVAR